MSTEINLSCIQGRNNLLNAFMLKSWGTGIILTGSEELKDHTVGWTPEAAAEVVGLTEHEDRKASM
jgi:hypothetical protein